MKRHLPPSLSTDQRQIIISSHSIISRSFPYRPPFHPLSVRRRKLIVRKKTIEVVNVWGREKKGWLPNRGRTVLRTWNARNNHVHKVLYPG
jgi:hypothetical protein